MPSLKSTGCFQNTVDRRDYSPTVSQITKSYIIPKKVNWLNYYKNEIMDQDGEGMCVGFATAYVAETKLFLQGTPVKLSRRMIYEFAQVYDGWGSNNDFCDFDALPKGTSIRGAMKAGYKHGFCPEESWTTIPLVKTQPSELMMYDASIHKIRRYYSLKGRIFGKIRLSLLLRLLGYTPLVGSFKLPSGFFDLPKNGIVTFNERYEEGLHAMAIMGVVVKNSSPHIVLLNSWSTNWGDNGKCYVPLNVFAKLIVDCMGFDIV